ncbi:unnamed protein product [Schistosoma turkestanicum]|nr:unnamed protein product [Schistosoma turkestanicum]
MPKSARQRNPLATSSVSKSVIRDDHWKSHNKSYRSSSLCKAQDSCRSALRSVTNIHENYGSLKHLNSIPVKKSVWNTDSNSKFVHNLANKFGGSVPFVANPDISYEPVHLRPVRQQCSRVYTAFDSNQRRPQVPFEPSLYFYPSTERILYSHSVQRAPVHLGSNHGESVLFSPRIPCISKDTSGSCLKTTTCGACGGSGQVVDNCNETNAASGRLTEPPLIRPNIGLNPLYRKALSSASLFENDENVCRNVILNSLNASTYCHDLGRIDQSARFGSPSRVNHQTGRSKPINFSSYAHNSSIYPKHSHHSNKSNNSNYFKKINKTRNTDVTYSSEDSNSSSTQIGDKHHSSSEGRRYDYSRQQSKGFRKSSSSTLFPASSALQEILEAASSTSRLAQKLRCSLEDLCKTELK